jgi:hypothetical protein
VLPRQQPRQPELRPSRMSCFTTVAERVASAAITCCSASTW